MSTSKKRQPGRPAKYPPECQADAVAMVLDEAVPRLRSPGRWG